jgi:hypothetical protein
MLSRRMFWRYLSWVEMLPNVVFSLVPMPLTATMITTEMPAAIRPFRWPSLPTHHPRTD